MMYLYLGPDRIVRTALPSVILADQEPSGQHVALRTTDQGLS